MSLDRLINHLIQLSTEDARTNKAQSLSTFKFVRTAGSLITPARERARHHRERENHYTNALEHAECELREKGVSVEVTDPTTGTAFQGSVGTVCSGAMYSPAQQFQPKIDQTLLDAVKRAKAKMLEHRDKAERYEKFARAFSCCPGLTVELSVEDAHFFQLEGNA